MKSMNACMRACTTRQRSGAVISEEKYMQRTKGVKSRCIQHRYRLHAASRARIPGLHAHTAKRRLARLSLRGSTDAEQDKTRTNKNSGRSRQAAAKGQRALTQQRYAHGSSHDGRRHRPGTRPPLWTAPRRLLPTPPRGCHRVMISLLA